MSFLVLHDADNDTSVAASARGCTVSFAHADLIRFLFIVMTIMAISITFVNCSFPAVFLRASFHSSHASPEIFSLVSLCQFMGSNFVLAIPTSCRQEFVKKELS